MPPNPCSESSHKGLTFEALLQWSWEEEHIYWSVNNTILNGHTHTICNSFKGYGHYWHHTVNYYIQKSLHNKSLNDPSWFIINNNRVSSNWQSEKKQSSCTNIKIYINQVEYKCAFCTKYQKSSVMGFSVPMCFTEMLKHISHRWMSDGLESFFFFCHFRLWHKWRWTMASHSLPL